MTTGAGTGLWFWRRPWRKPPPAQIAIGGLPGSKVMTVDKGQLTLIPTTNIFLAYTGFPSQTLSLTGKTITASITARQDKGTLTLTGRDIVYGLSVVAPFAPNLLTLVPRSVDTLKLDPPETRAPLMIRHRNRKPLYWRGMPMR